MRWRKYNLWKAGVVVGGVLLLLVFMTLVTISAADAHESVSGSATLARVTVQATPTVDATMTALNKEKLAQEVQQLKNQNEPDPLGWVRTNASIFLSTLVVVIGALFGLWRWQVDRRDAQDKELEDRRVERERRAEERFQRVVTDLGSERKEARIAAAAILFSFLQPDYEQFYRQIFDLAVTYLQSFTVVTSSSDTLSFDSFRQVLINVFKQSFLRVRGEWKEQKPRSLEPDLSDYDRLGGVNMQLDGAYLVHADLRGIWMRESSLRNAHLFGVKFTGSHLKGSNFTDAYLERAVLVNADCTRAIFTRAKLMEANFTGANISRTDFTEAILTGSRIELADSIKGAKLCHVVGLTKEQLEACKAKGATIDEDTIADISQPDVAPTPSTQSTHEQTPSVPLAQATTPLPSTDRSSSTTSQPSAEP